MFGEIFPKMCAVTINFVSFTPQMHWRCGEGVVSHPLSPPFLTLGYATEAACIVSGIVTSKIN